MTLGPLYSLFMPRFYYPAPLICGELLELPASAARHVQVLRMQPGHTITLFNGQQDKMGATGEFSAIITNMGRSSVHVQVGLYSAVERKARRSVHLAVAMPANDRMDWLVEKATELGVASIQALMSERSVVRLSGERADKKQIHWQSVVTAACEQCGGNQVPRVHQMLTLVEWLKLQASLGHSRLPGLLLSLKAGSLEVCDVIANHPALFLLAGPEGGLSQIEEDTAIACGFVPVSLGPRVLRTETAALFALASVLGGCRT